MGVDHTVQMRHLELDLLDLQHKSYLTSNYLAHFKSLFLSTVRKQNHLTNKVDLLGAGEGWRWEDERVIESNGGLAGDGGGAHSGLGRDCVLVCGYCETIGDEQKGQDLWGKTIKGPSAHIQELGRLHTRAYAAQTAPRPRSCASGLWQERPTLALNREDVSICGVIWLQACHFSNICWTAFFLLCHAP